MVIQRTNPFLLKETFIPPLNAGFGNRFFIFLLFSAFRKLTNTDCPGNDIGQCGIFRSKEEIEGKCMSDPNCMGYTMSREEGKIKDESIKDEDGMYPWCLKNCVSTNTPGTMPLSDFYMKMGNLSLIINWL